jgi:hypothetical protein
MISKPIYIIKADGGSELFDIQKLKFSLKRAGTSEKVVNEIVDHIGAELKDGMTTRDIYRHAFEMLHKQEKPIAIKYSLKKAVLELGPSGFPFEKFIAEIFKVKGYKTLTGQVVQGFCVEHEVDIIAWNKEQLIMCEAKFHNEPGMKSDLKVALYVKARFDDLRQMTFKYDRERKLDQGWLITNTKFSKTAIEYGTCQGGLVMIGWNFPPKGNLHDMILEAKLHPLTCLTSLKSNYKKALLDTGIVLCKTILENKSILKDINMKDNEIEKVLEEIESL